MRVLESEIERACRRYAKERGWELIKIQDIKGWPDRLLLGPHGQHMFIEFKRPGEKPRPLQEHIIKKLQTMRHNAIWIDSKKQFIQILQALDLRNGSLSHTKRRE